MNILITGSSGEIGTNLAIELQKLGHTVQGLDKRENTWVKTIPTTILDLSQRFSDYTNGFDSTPITKPEIVVHLAANAKVHELVVDPQRALDNITDCFNVLEYCRIQNIPIIFSSSREVYGDVYRFLTDRESVNETKAQFVYTESPYSASKIAGEALIHSYARCYKLPYLIFRFSNVYGRYDNDISRMERVIPLFIKKINNDEPITIYGKEKTLDFTYVDDTVQGLIKGIEKLSRGEVSNKTYNLAYGKGHTLHEMATYIAENLGKTINPTFEDLRPGEISYYVADITQAQTDLGYNPATTLKEGIAKTISWWKEHGDL